MSKLMSICVNLIYVNLLFLWTSSIVCVFDFLTFDIFFDILTSFWHFDIFLTIWHMAYNLNHLNPSQGYV